MNKQKDRVRKKGEVFTPPKLVDEMLDLIPSYEGKYLTYLDPCFGATCIFTIFLMFRLADALRNEIPDVKERINNIVEKQLYGVELDQKAFEYGVMIFKKYKYYE